MRKMQRNLLMAINMASGVVLLPSSSGAEWLAIDNVKELIVVGQTETVGKGVSGFVSIRCDLKDVSISVVTNTQALSSDEISQYSETHGVIEYGVTQDRAYLPVILKPGVTVGRNVSYTYQPGHDVAKDIIKSIALGGRFSVGITDSAQFGEQIFFRVFSSEGASLINAFENKCPDFID